MPISDATREDARRLVLRYPVARSALLPLLHLVQSDEGYVSEDGIALCAELLDMTKAEVGAVSTFYTMYKREPFGDYLLSVCTNPTCKVAGAQEIFDSYVDACGGTIDRDGAGVMVEHAECLGICDAAPVVQINYEMYGPVTHDEAMRLLEQSRAGDPPASNWSDAVPPTFRQVERELSGAEDGVDDHLIEAARLQTLAEVPPAYRSGETDIPVTHPGGDPAGHGGEGFREAAGLDLAPVATPAGPEHTDDVEARRVAADVVEETAGEARELADVTESRPAPGPTPSTQDQPETAEEAPETPSESERGAPARGAEALSGDEAEPGDTAGPDETRDEES